MRSRHSGAAGVRFVDGEWSGWTRYRRYVEPATSTWLLQISASSSVSSTQAPGTRREGGNGYAAAEPILGTFEKEGK